MKPIQQLFSEFGQNHQNHIDKLIHWIYVTLISSASLACWPTFQVNFKRTVSSASTALHSFWNNCTLLGLLFYLRLSFAMFSGMALVCGIVWWLVHLVATTAETPHWLSCLIIFVVALIGQFYGHK